MFTVAGTLASTSAPSALQAQLALRGVAAELRESAHYRSGTYVRVLAPGVHLSIEQASDTEHLCRGDAESAAALWAACTQLADALAVIGTACRFELYDENDVLLQMLPGS